VSSLLESKWVWVFFIFIILIVLCIVAYCFREHIGACVACIETCCYHTIKTLLLPFKILVIIVKTIFYPIKQTFLACKDRCARCLFPSEMKVSGLRY
jgi:hypothetical protein